MAAQVNPGVGGLSKRQVLHAARRQLRWRQMRKAMLVGALVLAVGTYWWVLAQLERVGQQLVTSQEAPLASGLQLAPQGSELAELLRKPPQLPAPSSPRPHPPGAWSDAVCKRLAAKYHDCGPLHFPTGFDPERGLLECDFDVRANLTYTPDPRLLDCVERVDPVEWAKDAAVFGASIERMQNPRDCNAPESRYFREPDWSIGRDANGEDMRVAGTGNVTDPSRPKWQMLGWLHHGWAYNLYVFAFNCANHWAAGVPVVVGNSKYRFSDLRCGRGYSCELSPLGKCAVEDIEPERVIVFGVGERERTVMNLAQVCKPHGRYVTEYGRCDCEDGYLPKSDPKYFYCMPYSAFDFSVPRKARHRQMYEEGRREAIEGDDVWFATNAPGEENPHNTWSRLHFAVPELRRKHGFLWMHAQALHYLMKDSRRRTSHEWRRRDLGLVGRRCIAMHVRHGDSCLDKYQNHRRCLPLSMYVEKARLLRQQDSGLDCVYLATDSPQVIRDAANFSGEFDFVFQKMDRSFYDEGATRGVDSRKAFNSLERVDEITSDIWIMAHCDALVGSFASSVAWVVYEMMVGRLGHYVPFASIDMPYAHRKNVGRFYEKDEHRGQIRNSTVALVEW